MADIEWVMIAFIGEGGHALLGLTNPNSLRYG